MGNLGSGVKEAVVAALVLVACVVGMGLMGAYSCGRRSATTVPAAAPPRVELPELKLEAPGGSTRAVTLESGTTPGGARWTFALNPPADTSYSPRVEYRRAGRLLLYTTRDGAIIMPSTTTTSDLLHFIVETPPGCGDGR